SLLVHGARAVVRTAPNKTDPNNQWVNQLRERRGFNRATVAVAKKNARMIWAVLRRGELIEMGLRPLHELAFRLDPICQLAFWWALLHSRCICGRPPPCKDFFAWFDQIACAHMSGLYVRLHVSAGQDGFRNKSSKQTGGLIECHCTERSISCRGSTDHTICLSPCKFWHRPPSAQHGYNYFAPRIWLIFRLRLPRCL